MSGATGSKNRAIANLVELEDFARDWIRELPDKCLILLRGPMGAGKTKLVETVVRCMGGAEVSSPTFALHQQYQLPNRCIHHFDLYRLESEEEIMTAGFWEILHSNKGWIFVEWPERLGPIQKWPNNLIVFDLKIIIGEGSRRTIEYMRL